MKEVAEELNKFLCNLVIFGRKVQNYHWNVSGRDFFVLHEKLEEYYNDINEQIDEIGEQILIMGYQPYGTLKDCLEHGKLDEAENKKISGADVYSNVIVDMGRLLKQCIDIKVQADKADDYATSSIMDDYIVDYRKKLWMLNQSIKEAE